uniref:Uncharacterized protein n=1 Tax=Arundo donax TaxID=35708 RepID=A0A0A8Z496_ARUDO
MLAVRRHARRAARSSPLTTDKSVQVVDSVQMKITSRSRCSTANPKPPCTFAHSQWQIKGKLGEYPPNR